MAPVLDKGTEEYVALGAISIQHWPVTVVVNLDIVRH
jgi:hypothetical protein